MVWSRRSTFFILVPSAKVPSAAMHSALRAPPPCVRAHTPNFFFFQKKNGKGAYRGEEYVGANMTGNKRKPTTATASGPAAAVGAKRVRVSDSQPAPTSEQVRV